MRTWIWKYGISFSRVHSLLPRILHWSPQSACAIDFESTRYLASFGRSKNEVSKSGGKSGLVEPKRHVWGRHEGANKQKSMDREESFEGSGQIVISHICEDISSESGVSPERHGIIHKFTITILALPTRKGSSWLKSESRVLRECGKENQTLRGFHFECWAAFRPESSAGIFNSGKEGLLNYHHPPSTHSKDLSRDLCFPKQYKNHFINIVSGILV